MHIPVGLPILHTPQKVASVPMNKQQGAFRHGLLDRVKDIADAIGKFGRPNQKMSMFRHNDIRPNMERELPPSPINRVDQPLATSVLAQERLPPKAGKGEGMGVARVVEPLASLAMRHG
jgi:hypothetical protein